MATPDICAQEGQTAATSSASHLLVIAQPNRILSSTCCDGFAITGKKWAPNTGLPLGALQIALRDEFLLFCDRLRRAQALWAHVGAVHDLVASIEAEWVLEMIESLAGGYPFAEFWTDQRFPRFVMVANSRPAVLRLQQ